MAELIAHGRAVTNVFDLIGDLENDITKSIAWCLIKCPRLLEKCIEDLLKIEINSEDTIVRYQVSEADKGITDLEITDNQNFYVIIEAKRGWILPGYSQLQLYSTREGFKINPAKHKAIVSLSECSEEYAYRKLPNNIKDTRLLHLSWKSIYEMVDKVRFESTHSQKYILDELKKYIGRIMTTQNQNTNWVYVVSLGKTNAEVISEKGKSFKSDITYLDIVRKYHKYCCPVGGGKGGWPKEPLTYIAFRYDGKLQSIHHIESYVITDKLHQFIPEIPDITLSNMHFVYTLGPAIIPSKEIRVGKKIVRSNRVWAHIDALLTSDTISDAMNISKKREETYS